MNTQSYRSIIAVVVFGWSALSSRADETTYAQVIKERDSVLSQILAERENRRSSGTADEEAIAAAQLVLYSFRRDVAATNTDKIKNQELIVRVFEQKLEYEKARMSAGVGAEINVLEAKAPLLEARQILEELLLKAKNG